MEESFSRKRPSFEQFREWFVKEVKKYTPVEIKNTYMAWAKVGDEELREDIIEAFMQTLEKRFGFRPVFNERLSTMDGSMESVIIRIFHVFSTMFLVDHINEKMYKQRKNKMH